MPAESLRQETMLPALVLAALVAPAQTGLATIRYDAPPPNLRFQQSTERVIFTTCVATSSSLTFGRAGATSAPKELRDFVRAEKLYGGRVDVVTISNEDPGVAASYLQTWEIHLPLVEDVQSAISRLYSVSRIPVTLVLDPSGAVSYVSVGGLSWEELSQAIERAQASPTASTRASGVLQ